MAVHVDDLVALVWAGLLRCTSPGWEDTVADFGPATKLVITRVGFDIHFGWHTRAAQRYESWAAPLVISQLLRWAKATAPVTDLHARLRSSAWKIDAFTLRHGARDLWIRDDVDIVCVAIRSVPWWSRPRAWPRPLEGWWGHCALPAPAAREPSSEER